MLMLILILMSSTVDDDDDNDVVVDDDDDDDDNDEKKEKEKEKEDGGSGGDWFKLQFRMNKSRYRSSPLTNGIWSVRRTSCKHTCQGIRKRTSRRCNHDCCDNK